MNKPNYLRKLHPFLIACCFAEYGQRYPLADVGQYDLDDLNDILSEWIDLQDAKFREMWKESE